MSAIAKQVNSWMEEKACMGLAGILSPFNPMESNFSITHHRIALLDFYSCQRSCVV